MASVLLDVGAHIGQTLEEVTKPEHGFDLIYAFEPMPAQFAALRQRFADIPGVVLCQHGLAGRTGGMSVYGTNEHLEASIYPTKKDVDATVVTYCQVIEASEFFRRHLTVTDHVFMKLNCEGAEVDILNNLLDTGEIGKVTNVMIDFDIRKVTGLEEEEWKLLERFRSVGFGRYSLCDDVMRGDTHQERIAHWLSTVGR